MAHQADVATQGPFHNVQGGVGLGMWTAHVTHVGSLPVLSIPPPSQGPALVGEWMAVRATLTAGEHGLSGAELEVRLRTFNASIECLQMLCVCVESVSNP